MGKSYKNRAGNRQGKKNLKYLPNGKIANQHGVTFTEKEKRALESAVNMANRKRAKQLKEVATLPRTVRGIDTGDTLSTKLQMGFESDFIISKKSKSLQRFTTREQYDKYMRYLKSVNSPTYLDDRTRLYKRNYIAALQRVHGDASKDIQMKVRMMKPGDFRKLIEQEELVEINDIYAPQDAVAEREKLRASFGMKSKEDDTIENYDEF